MSSGWEERYRDRSAHAAQPAAVLRQNLRFLAPPGRALDLACGLGANAVVLARAGYGVDAWDLSPPAIHKLRDHAAREALAIEAAVRDVVAAPPPAASYDLIVVSRFLERALCPAIAAALRPGGLLFYQTFFGAGPRPSNPAWRLESGELPRLFAGLDTLVYREENTSGEACLVARRHAQERHVAELIKNLESMLAAGNDTPLLRFGLGKACLDAHRPAEAARHLACAVERQPDYSAAWKLLGKALAQSGKREEAIGAWSQGIRVAEAKGDIQAAKEMKVFLGRVQRGA